jgi:D-serine deaminase-like pyridoxal phosphate-dependent protein
VSRSGSQTDLRRFDTATAALDPPFAIVDMAAFRANAATVVRRAEGKPMRLASKSVRCRRPRHQQRVWMRHAKAGELCERFSELHLIEGDAVTAVVPTYRGEGQNLL